MEAVALLSYVGVGAVGWVTARSFLANLAGSFPAGEIGALFSSGAIWVLGTIIGLKVAVTITGLFNRLSESAEGHLGPHDD